MSTPAKPLAIVAGSGAIPLHVAAVAEGQGRPVLILGIHGEADPEISRYRHEWIKWGEVGRVESLIRKHGANEVVLVGGVHARPDIRSIKPDFGFFTSLPRMMSLFRNGDSDLLSGIVAMFEQRGFRVIGAHQIAEDLVAGPGPLGRHAPDADATRDVERGMTAAVAIGLIDAGQAAVSVNGRVVALEAAEGTDAMLERVAALRQAGRLKWEGRVGALVKCAKPQQDLRVDMPTIGPRTVASVAAAGLAGIAVEANRVMLADREATLRAADAAGIFIVGRDRPGGGVQ